MADKALYQYFFILFKDYRILKILFTILATYLIYDEFKVFLIKRPTYTSTEKRKMNPEDFPEIILCPEPSIDINAVRSRGYLNTVGYFKGRYNSSDLQLISWGGNTSEGEDVKIISEEISALKSATDCEKVKLYFKDTKSSKRIYTSSNLVRAKAFYPYHQCCKVIPPTESHIYPLLGSRFYFSILNDSIYGSAQVFLKDLVSTSYFDQYKKFMIGDKIVSNGKGMMNYKVKIMEDKKIENDPQYQCIDYRIREATFSKSKLLLLLLHV